jgi:hypothetical protein
MRTRPVPRSIVTIGGLLGLMANAGPKEMSITSIALAS